MRIGLLADIHEDVEHLALGLDRFRREGVDRVVNLGDILKSGRRIGETIDLLEGAGAVGVWGNHDYALCVDPPPSLRDRVPRRVLDHFARLRPSLTIGDGFFSHIEPGRDPRDPVHLWSYDRQPDSPSRLALNFAAAPHRLLFMGHIHRWSVATPDGRLPWDCFSPLLLEPDRRYLVVVGPVCDGRCGIWDTEAGLLIPIDLRDG